MLTLGIDRHTTHTAAPHVQLLRSYYILNRRMITLNLFVNLTSSPSPLPSSSPPVSSSPSPSFPSVSSPSVSPAVSSPTFTF